MKKVVLLIVIVVFFTNLAIAQETDFELIDSFLFGDATVTVASKKPLTTRESPGILTVVKAKEIQRAGARDLMDLLGLVPGFYFGVDVQGVVGLGVRGNWAHEGKVLLLWDGQEMNETLYSTLQFGNRFPVDQIEKIEIIRGPGSPLYGGAAELAVINIVTKSAKELNGVSATFSYGQMEETFGQRNVSVAFGRKFDKFSITASAFYGEGNRSDQDYTDFYEQTYNMKDNSELNPLNINLGLQYKGLTARFMMDKYNTTMRDAFDEAYVDEESYPDAPYIDFNSYFFSLAYDYKINEKFSINPQFNYKRQLSWHNNDVEPDDYLLLDKSTERFKGILTASYDFNENTNLILGGEFFRDKAKINGDKHTSEDYFENGEKEIHYDNIAFLGQLIFKTPLTKMNFTAGARYDDNDAFGSAFVPRLAVTKIIDKFHFKILGSGAFRAPAIENIRTTRAAIKEDILPKDKEVDPERTLVFELEAGYELTDNMFITANAFDIKIEDPIVYVYNEDFNIEYYINSDETGTRGFEVEYRTKADWGYGILNYSYYQVAYDGVPHYEVEDDKNLHLGFPGHKISLNSSFKVVDNFYISPTATYLSNRYGYAPDQYEEPILKKFDPVLLANLFANYENLFTEGLDIGVGVYDILGENYQLIQPYNGFHASLPSNSREFLFKLSYDFKLK